jgi:hypothetical protein
MWYVALYGVLALWVLFDALERKLGAMAVLWALGTAVLGPFVLPIYVAKRPLKKGEVREGGTAWNVLKNFAILWTVVMAVATLAGLMAVSEHTSRLESGAATTGAAVGTAIGLGLLGVVWFVPTMGAALLAFLLKKNSIIEAGPSGPLAGTTSGASVMGGWAGLVGTAFVGLLVVGAIENLNRGRPAKQEGTSQTASTPVAHNWEVSESNNPMDGSKRVILSLDAENEVPGTIGSHRPTLFLRCAKKKTEVAIDVGSAIQPEYGNYETYTVRIKFDSAAPITQEWRGGTNMQSLFAPNGIQMAKRLAQTHTFLFEFKPFQRGPETVTFELSGLSEHLDKIADACNWGKAAEQAALRESEKLKALRAALSTEIELCEDDPPQYCWSPKDRHSKFGPFSTHEEALQFAVKNVKSPFLTK